ncbi:MAG: heavy metal translocating P-type ATPase [Oscillospiraceae bacterium]
MNKKQKKQLKQLIIGTILFVICLILTHFTPLGTMPKYIQAIPFIITYLVLGFDVVKKSIKNIGHGQLFDENFLMVIAGIGAFIVGECSEGVAVMLFFKVGEFFEKYAVNKSRTSISSLMDIRPDVATIEKDGKLIQVDPETVAIGDTIIVSAGEKIAIDGVVIEGSSSVDTSTITGESVPRKLSIGDSATSGFINLTGTIKIKTEKKFTDSTVSKILDLVENASSKKAEAEKFITKFAKYYTPIVVGLAVVIAIFVPLITGQEFSKWIYRALTFLVISCPCALVISVPLGFFGGIGGASSQGILIKGSNCLETLAKVDTIAFDKTGTLTEGVFKVTEINPKGDISKDTLLELTAYGESFSNHPVSLSLKEAYGKDIDITRVKDTKEIAGKGVSSVVDGTLLYVGNSNLMDSINIKYDNPKTIGTIVHVATEKQYLGYIIVSDVVKSNSKDTIQGLKSLGIKKTIMLTGDINSVAENIANQIGVDEFHAELMPQDKAQIVQDYKNKGATILFTGDGINDAPVLALSDVSVAMGALGSDSAIEVSDIVIMNDDISKIGTSIKIAKRTLSIVKQNIVFAISVKIIVMILGAFGIAKMGLAIFADVGVSVIAILNAMRTLKFKK